MDAKLCREALLDCLNAMENVLCDPEGIPCFQGSDGDRQVIYDAMSKGYEAVNTVNAPSPEVDEIVNEAIMKGWHEDESTRGIKNQVMAAIRPYLAQGAVKVDLDACRLAVIQSALKGQGAIEAVILSLKQQNPDKEFQDVD